MFSPQDHAPSPDFLDAGKIHSRWNWGRFTAKDGTLYAIPLDWPGNERAVTIKALAKGAAPLAGQQVAGVTLLGHAGALSWSHLAAGLQATLPAAAPCRGPVALKIALTPAQ